MKTWVKRIGLAIVLALFSVLGVAVPAQATDLCVQPVVCATVTLPNVTVTDIIKLPATTVTKTVKVPYPVTTTDIVKVPGPVTTRYVTLPRETVTRNGQTVPTGQTTTVRGTVTERVTETVTSTASPVTVTKTQEVVLRKTITKDGVVTVHKAKAVGISLGLLLLGAVLAILALWATYAVGYKDSELNNEKWAKSILTDLFRKR